MLNRRRFMSGLTGLFAPIRHKAATVFNRLGVGVRATIATLQVRGAPYTNGEINGMAIYSEGVHLFERDQQDNGSNGGVLVLRRRNMDHYDSRSILKLAGKPKNRQTPTKGFGTNFVWVLPDHIGKDRDSGWMGYRYAETPGEGCRKVGFWMGGTGDKVLCWMEIDDDAVRIDPWNDGMKLQLGDVSLFVQDGAFMCTGADGTTTKIAPA